MLGLTKEFKNIFRFFTVTLYVRKYEKYTLKVFFRTTISAVLVAAALRRSKMERMEPREESACNDADVRGAFRVGRTPLLYR